MGERLNRGRLSLMSKYSHVPESPSDPNDPAAPEQEAARGELVPGHGRAAFGAVRALSVLLPVAIIVVILDQVSKIWAERTLELGGAPKPFIGTLIQLRLIYNPGAALSLGSGMTWVLTLISIGVVVFIAIMAKKLSSQLWVITLGLLLGGALGNLIDRLFRAPGFPEGHVVDFLDYGIFIGNVADIAIVGAAILIGVLSLIGIAPFDEPAKDKK